MRDEAPTLSEAIGRLNRERTLAEDGASQLKRFAADDRAAQIEGEQLYAAARADFNGLIEQLLSDLDQGVMPQGSAGMERELEAMVEKRLAFSRHVAAAARTESGTKSGALAGALLGLVPDLAKGLMQGLGAIWTAHRQGNELQRKAIATRLEAQRWKSFAEVS